MPGNRLPCSLIFLTKHKPELANKNRRDPDMDIFFRRGFFFLAVLQMRACVEGPVSQGTELRIAAGAIGIRNCGCRLG